MWQFYCIVSCCCIVVLCRWFIPFIGHMGICTMQGVIRDFAGPYFVSVSKFCIIILPVCHVAAAAGDDDI